MGNSASALPYTIGDETHPSTRPGSYGFSMHSGERKSDSMPVTVFKGAKSTMAKEPLVKTSSDPTMVEIFPALHHYSKLKKLMHPHILRVYATLDTDFPNGDEGTAGNGAKGSSAVKNGNSSKGSYTDAMNPNSLSALEQTPTTGELIIVTEPVITLQDYLAQLSECTVMSDQQKQHAIAWGIYSIIQALTFLHTTVKVAHGNICEHAIYVTPAGDFKLSSLQLLTSVGINDGATGPTPHFRHFERDVTPLQYRSPERIEGRWDAISTSPIHAMDSYSLGVFITNLYAHDGAGTYGQLPAKLEKAMMRLKTKNVSTRPRVLPLTKCPVFANDYIKTQLFLSEIATQPNEAKISFYKGLIDLLNRKTIAPSVAEFKILPLLRDTLMQLVTADMGLTQEINKRECLAILPPLFYISAQEYKDNDTMGVDKEKQQGFFQKEIGPLLHHLFRVNDRAVRGALLSRMQFFAANLDAPMLNSAVFEPMCSGFSDSSSALRELTLKSAIALVSVLTTANLEKLTRYLVRLQSDPENGIRTNTVIFIGKVSPNLSDMTRSKLILPAFVRSMSDPFYPCRLAGLRSMSACRKYFDEKALATDVLPAISPSLVDNVEEVRMVAFTVMEEFLTILREYGEVLGEEERRRNLLEKSGVTVNGSSTNSGSSSSNVGQLNNGQAGPAASSNSGYLSGLGSWASSKMVSSTQPSAPTPAMAPMNMSTAATPNGTLEKKAQSLKQPEMKPMPTFSSFSLNDAKIGGNTDGWSDEDDDDNMGSSNTYANDSSVVIPTFDDDDDDDDFMKEFEKKPTIRPRSTLGSMNSGSSLKKFGQATKTLGGVKKLSLDSALDEGWDDF